MLMIRLREGQGANSDRDGCRKPGECVAENSKHGARVSVVMERYRPIARKLGLGAQIPALTRAMGTNVGYSNAPGFMTLISNTGYRRHFGEVFSPRAISSATPRSSGWA